MTTTFDLYLQACHAMQTGVALTLGKDPSSASPKHLRVGVNAAMSDHGALVGLLEKKGLITHEEYLAAITNMMQEEVKNYEISLHLPHGTLA